MVYNWLVLTLTIDRELPEAVYEQIARQVRRLVASGQLAAGTKLPSVRQLARDLGVNLNTIARAYRLLDSEGFLLIRERAGVEVAPPAARIARPTRAVLVQELREVLARMRQAGMEPELLHGIVAREIEALGDRPGRSER